MVNTWLTETFQLKHPIIMAPMFLVTNEEMLIAAHEAGITGCIPALNFRTPELFKESLSILNDKCQGNFGVNLIVNKSNLQLKKQIDACKEIPPAFIITSLGSPKDVIKELSPLGVKVICDVVDAEYAKKVESLGADAIIAVNSGAGGHAGPIPASILVPMIKKECKLPVISAGGVGTGPGLLATIALGAEGASVGSPFIASKESGVSEGYKRAIIDYGADDIALTTKISGTPCTVIKTPYVKKIGLDQNVVERFLNTNKSFKKYAKMLTYYKGMKLLEKAAFAATYKSVWCAGPSIEFVEKTETINEIITRISQEYQEAYRDMQSKNIWI
jgi:nitronate monooxygenase